MEAEGLGQVSINNSQMGVSSDISHALERKKHMMALVPLKGELPRQFLGSLYQEARQRKKKLFVLSKRSDVGWISTVIRGIAGESEQNGSIVSFTSFDLKCNLDGSDNDPGDLLNHCVRKDRMDLCPYQTGFDLSIYRDIKMSGGTLLGEMSDDIKQKGMCPARTAVDISTEAGTIITDYSFVFSEGWDKLFDFMGQDPSDTILAICDPSSLIDHLWSRFTYSFRLEELHFEGWELNGLEEDPREGFSILMEIMRDMAASWDIKKPLERKVLLQAYRSRSQAAGVRTGLGSLIIELKDILKKGDFKTITGRKRVKDLYLFLKLWMKEHTSVARTVEEDRDGRMISLSLLDLQVMVRPILESFPSVFMFGDTLYPQGLYTKLLGLRPENTLNRSYITMEHMESTSVVSFGNVETSYKHRGEDMWRSILKNIQTITDSTPGMVTAIFPSYFIQEAVMDAMVDMKFSRPVLEESRGMNKDEKRRLLDEIKLGGDGLILCVQGGSVSRAIEEGGIKTDTAVIVGMHIPPPTPRSNQLKVHMQRKHGTNLGHVISVLLPALTSVMKYVNTMSENAGEGKNLVVLMDRRYQDARVLESLPRFYDIKLLSGSNDYHGERYFK
ncbi:MAG: helicase C-terminal domain-containing protein [Thermoplasmatota archaeon]